jgi:hypothetical protein
MGIKRPKRVDFNTYRVIVFYMAHPSKPDPTPYKSVRIQPSAWAEIDEYARLSGASRIEVISAAVLMFVTADAEARRATLIEVRNRGLQPAA